MCSIWAEASDRRWRRVSELDPRPGRDLSPDEQTELLGEVFLGLIALEEAFWWARWLIANHDGSLAALSARSPDGTPIPQEQVDIQWLAAKARRDAIAHLENEVREHPDGGILIHGGRIVIGERGPEYIAAARLWSALLSEWAAELPIDLGDTRGEQVPQKPDDRRLPTWLQSRTTRDRQAKAKRKTDAKSKAAEE